jgi:hypothetical protein
MSALKAAAVLGAKEDRTMLIRATASIAAEEPDKLGHGFIMPTSLAMELPAPEYTRPHIATLWHLTEYLSRKVSSKAVDGFSMDEKIGKIAKLTDLSHNQNLFLNSVINFGTLGHNAIFAHRISEAARLGLVNTNTIQWLLKKLERNVGSKFDGVEDLSLTNLISKKEGTDWDVQPTEISLPSSKKVREWICAEHGDIWDAMFHQESSVFDNMILEMNDDFWSIVRALQYAMTAITGDMEAPHPMIFTQAVWGLVDNGLVPESLAALQIHRMLRTQLIQ